MSLRNHSLAIALSIFIPTALLAGDALWLAENGAARASIVTAENPPRLVALAAKELH